MNLFPGEDKGTVLALILDPMSDGFRDSSVSDGGGKVLEGTNRVEGGIDLLSIHVRKVLEANNNVRLSVCPAQCNEAKTIGQSGNGGGDVLGMSPSGISSDRGESDVADCRVANGVGLGGFPWRGPEEEEELLDVSNEVVGGRAMR